MKDIILESYLKEAEREDLVSAIEFLEIEYNAEFVFAFAEFVGGREKAHGTVDVIRGFELDGFLPASNNFGCGGFHGDAILQKGERPMIRIAHFTSGVKHLSEITEIIVRKIVEDIPSVKTKIRMMFEVSGKIVPWYLRKGSP